MKVYNDLNKDLYFTFKVLQDERKRKQLENRLRNCFAHETIFQELKRSDPKTDIDIAFKTIYLHTFSFSGAGTSFKRFYKKANTPPVRTENFLLVKKWIVENMDFRSLMEKYNRERVLLYLDPPYLRGGTLYRYSFKLNDFADMNKLLKEHKGTYLLNLSLFDEEMTEIFGEPDKVVDYVNPINKSEQKQRWGCGYWWRA